MERENLSANDLAKHADLTPAAIYKYIGSKSLPKIDVMERLLGVFPKVSARWLLTGAGDMYEYESTGSGKMKLDPEDLDYEAKVELTTCREQLVLKDKEIEYLRQQVDNQQELLKLYRKLNDQVE